MRKSVNTVFPHLLAASIALTYAWFISQTAYVQTGLQFIAPLLIILSIHTVYMAVGRNLSSGFSLRAITRSIQTTTLLAFALLAGSLFAPLPAQANAGEVVQGILIVLFCLFILAVILAILAFIVWMIVKFCRWAFGKNDNENDTLNDFGTLIFVAVFLGVASLEGLPRFYSFEKSANATASQVIDADVARVWHTMETATSPAIQLPNILSTFPRPTAVIVDQGTRLGANRQIKFEGREGEGYLRLQVIERTPTKAVFEVLSDTTPFAGWISYKHLTYFVTPKGDQTQLNVTLDFDRDLSPAWFFKPMMRGASYFAMSVLATDIKNRAENPDG